MNTIVIPARFMAVPYEGSRYPGAPGVVGLVGGANCQQFAYELLRYFGRTIPNFRSSDLWDDRDLTAVVRGAFEPLDLLLWHDRPEAWGAHVGLYLGDHRAIHLAKSVGHPAVWSLDGFAERPEYRFFIGAKRIRA